MQAQVRFWRIIQLIRMIHKYFILAPSYLSINLAILLFRLIFFALANNFLEKYKKLSLTV